MISLKTLTLQDYFVLCDVTQEWNTLWDTAGPVDRPAAEAACRRAYRSAGLPEPDRIIWSQSPFAAFVTTFRMRGDLQSVKRIGKSVKSEIWLSPWSQVEEDIGFIDRYRQHWRSHFLDQYLGNLENDPGSHLPLNVRQLLNRNLTDGVVAAWLLAQVGDQAKDDIAAKVAGIPPQSQSTPATEDMFVLGLWDEIWREIRFQRWEQVLKCNGCVQPTSWAVFFDGLGRLGCNVGRLHGLIDLARFCPMFWPYEHLAILVDRPIVMYRDEEGHFHHGHLHAVEYADGWGFFAWHGVRVPEQLIHHPEQLTVSAILAEPNIEVRRVMIDHFGIDRLLSSTRAHRLDQDSLGGRKLFRLHVPDDEPVVGLRLRCPSTGQIYFVRVPPHMKTCTEAVAWTFGLDKPADYRPKVEM